MVFIYSSFLSDGIICLDQCVLESEFRSLDLLDNKTDLESTCTMKIEAQTSDDLCMDCRIGKMTQKKVTHVVWVRDAFIMVPDFPARVCDFCGKREFDGQALARLYWMLNADVAAQEIRPFKPPAKSTENRHRPGWTE